MLPVVTHSGCQFYEIFGDPEQLETFSDDILKENNLIC